MSDRVELPSDWGSHAGVDEDGERSELADLATALTRGAGATNGDDGIPTHQLLGTADLRHRVSGAQAERTIGRRPLGDADGDGRITEMDGYVRATGVVETADVAVDPVAGHAGEIARGLTLRSAGPSASRMLSLGGCALRIAALAGIAVLAWLGGRALMRRAAALRAVRATATGDSGAVRSRPTPRASDRTTPAQQHRPASPPGGTPDGSMGSSWRATTPSPRDGDGVSCAAEPLLIRDQIPAIAQAAGVVLGRIRLPRSDDSLRAVQARTVWVGGDRVDMFTPPGAKMAVRYTGATAAVRTLSIAFDRPTTLCRGLQLTGLVLHPAQVQVRPDGEVVSVGNTGAAPLHDAVHVRVRGSTGHLQALQLDVVTP